MRTRFDKSMLLFASVAIFFVTLASYAMKSQTTDKDKDDEEKKDSNDMRNLSLLVLLFSVFALSRTLPGVHLFLIFSTLFTSTIILSSFFYIWQTRNIGTPLLDSLTKEQKEIRAESKKKRGNIFYSAMLAANIASLVFFLMMK